MWIHALKIHVMLRVENANSKSSIAPVARLQDNVAITLLVENATLLVRNVVGSSAMPIEISPILLASSSTTKLKLV